MDLVLPIHTILSVTRKLIETRWDYDWSLDWEDPLEEGMAAHSSVLAWRIPWAEEAGRLQSMGCKELAEQLTLYFHFMIGSWSPVVTVNLWSMSIHQKLLITFATAILPKRHRRFFYQYFSCHPSGSYSVSLTSFWNWLSVLSLNPLPSTPGVPVEDWVEYRPVVLVGQGETMLWRNFSCCLKMCYLS